MTWGSRIRRHVVNNRAQDRNKWWAAVNKVIYIQVPQNVENFSSSWENILLIDFVILLNSYNLKCQFIIVRWVLAFCVSIWTRQLFTISHDKTYLRYFLFYWILIYYHYMKLVVITVNTELLDWGTILICVKQQ